MTTARPTRSGPAAATDATARETDAPAVSIAAPAGAPVRVADLMHPDPVVIEANAGLAEAARRMDAHRVHGLPVIDGAGHLVGVLSHTDLLRARSTEYLWTNWPGLAVRHLMTAPAVTVTRATSLAAAAVLMEQRRIHRLVVVAEDDPRRPVGILSTTDLIHAMVSGPDAHGEDRTDG